MITSELRQEIIRAFNANFKSRMKRDPSELELNLFLTQNDHRIKSINTQLQHAVQKVVNEHIEEMTKNENTSSGPFR